MGAGRCCAGAGRAGGAEGGGPGGIGRPPPSPLRGGYPGRELWGALAAGGRASPAGRAGGVVG
jgi:hypothetical protein